MFPIRSLLPLAVLLLGGCATTHVNPQDPLEPLNRGVYQFNDALDRAVVKPVAKGYNFVMPAPGKMMVTNFFSNLDDVVVAVNDLLQLKLKQAVADTGRVAVNTTVGLFGLVDVATHVGLEKHNEDFGQTLGYWGVGPGPYLVLPLFGPSTVRDGIGDYADSFLGVWHQVDDVESRNQLLATDLLNQRARLLDDEALLNEAVLDRYTFIRDAYLQRRLNRVYDGHPPRPKYEDEDEDEDDGKKAAKPENSSTGDDDKSPGWTRIYRMWVVPRR